MSEDITLGEIRQQIRDLSNNLTLKQKKFTEIYLVNGGNGTAAYMEAFGNKNAKSSSVGASKLIRRPEIQAYLDLCRTYSTDEVLNHLTVTQNRVLDEEANLAFIDVRKMFDVNGELLPPQYWPEEIARAAAGIDIDQKWDPETDKWKYRYKIKFNDKGRALGRLETVLGMNKMSELTDDQANMFKSFLESIDGKSRGVLPSEIDD